MNLIEQTARLIDPESFDALPVYYDGSGQPLVESELRKSRREYMQSKALHIAFNVLKLACSQLDLREQLIAAELDGWVKLGISPEAVSQPIFRDMVRQKYGL